jgi:hypothetical protein
VPPDDGAVLAADPQPEKASELIEMITTAENSTALLVRLKFKEIKFDNLASTQSVRIRARAQFNDTRV